MVSHNPRPLIGVGAVLLTPVLDRVLLVRRGVQPALGRWSVPGGAVEWGESLAEACRREVREETGIDVQPRGEVKVLERIIGSDPPTHHVLIVDFWAVIPEQPLTPASDVTDARWVGRNRVAELETTYGLQPVIARAVALARGELPATALFEVSRTAANT